MTQAEDAGTISAQVRLEITQMEKDAIDVQKRMDYYAGQYQKLGDKGGKLYVKGFGNAQLALNKKLNTMVSSLQGVSPKMGAMGDKMASVFSKPIFSMVPAVSAAFQTMLPVIGTVIAVIGVLIKGIFSAVKAQKEFAANVNLSKEVSEKLKGSVVELSAAQKTSADITARQEHNSAAARLAFQKFGDFLGKIFLPVINGVRGAFTALGDAVSWVSDKLGIVSKEEAAAAAEAQKLKGVNEDLKKSLAGYEAELKNIAQAQRAGVKTAAEAQREELSALEGHIDSLVRARTEAANAAGESAGRVKELDEAIAGLVSQREGLQRLAESASLLEGSKKAAGDYQNQLKNLDNAVKTGAKTELQAAKDKLSAIETYIDSQVKSLTETVRLHGAESALAKQAEEKIRNLVRERNEVITLIEQYALLNDIDVDREAINRVAAARNRANAAYDDAERKARQDKALGLITELQLQERLKDAELARYNALEDLVALERLTEENSLYTIPARDVSKAIAENIVKERTERRNILELRKTQAGLDEQLTRQEIERLNAAASLADTEERKNGLLDEAVRLENKLLAEQRRRERDALKSSAAYIAADIAEQEQILRKFDLVTDGMMKVRAEAEKKPKKTFLEMIFGDHANEVMEVGNAAISAFDSISSASLEVSRKHAEEIMAVIDEVLDKTLDNIQKAREAQLIAEGFAVENSIESMGEQLEAAKRIGDEVLQYQLERRIREQEINDEYDAKAKEAEERAAREKAKLEFEVAKQEHAVRMIGAVNAGVMAVLQALSSAPPPFNFILAGLSGTATGVQIGMLAANPPKPPKFANSGIVPGNRYKGDRNLAAVDSGELILSRAHQDNIANQLTANAAPAVTATIVLVLDGRPIAESTVNLVNKGYYTIEARAVR